jgi:hypothetical protein
MTVWTLSIIVVALLLALALALVMLRTRRLMQRTRQRNTVETTTVQSGRVHVLARAEHLEGPCGAVFGRSPQARLAPAGPLEYPWLSLPHHMLDTETHADPVGPLHILRVDDAEERLALERAAAPGTKLRFAKKPTSQTS